MIYRLLLKDRKVTAKDLHDYGEILLAYGLFKEKGIVYKKEGILKNPWGKPELRDYPNIYFNISHSLNCIVCVISDRCPVGIDVEKVRTANRYAAQRVCSLEELERIYAKEDSNREFFRHWTLKESYIKAIGQGISFPMRGVQFKILSDGRIISNVQDCSFKLMEDVNDFITAVCYTNIQERQ